MSEEYSSAITLPEDTTGAIEELKTRGIRFRDRGLRVLGYAGAAAVLAVGAYLLYLNVQPMSAFTTIDLPALSESVASITAGPGGITSPFNSAFDSLRGVLTGALPKALAVGAILISGIVGVATGRITTAFTGLMMAFPILFLPSVLDVMAPSGGTSSAQQANGNSFLHQLVEEKRYKELAGAASELMPPEQSAYVKAQIAYLSKDADGLKAELGSLAGSKLDKWSPNWERMNVLETEAFGAPKIKGTVAFAEDVRSSMQSRQKIYGSSGAIAILAGLIGGGLFGFGMMLIRRAQRLEAMLGIAAKDGKDTSFAAGAASFFGLKQRERLEDARNKALEYQNPGWTPAWQRPGQRPAPEPVPSSAGSGPSMMEGVLVGAAAGMVASAILDDDRPSRIAHDSSPAYCPPIDSPVADTSPCISGSDCGSVGCE